MSLEEWALGERFIWIELNTRYFAPTALVPIYIIAWNHRGPHIGSAKKIASAVYIYSLRRRSEIAWKSIPMAFSLLERAGLTEPLYAETLI